VFLENSRLPCEPRHGHRPRQRGDGNAQFAHGYRIRSTVCSRDDTAQSQGAHKADQLKTDLFHKPFRLKCIAAHDSIPFVSRPPAREPYAVSFHGLYRCRNYFRTLSINPLFLISSRMLGSKTLSVSGVCPLALGLVFANWRITNSTPLRSGMLSKPSACLPRK